MGFILTKGAEAQRVGRNGLFERNRAATMRERFSAINPKIQLVAPKLPSDGGRSNYPISGHTTSLSDFAACSTTTFDTF